MEDPGEQPPAAAAAPVEVAPPEDGAPNGAPAEPEDGAASVAAGLLALAPSAMARAPGAVADADAEEAAAEAAEDAEAEEEEEAAAADAEEAAEEGEEAVAEGGDDGGDGDGGGVAMDDDDDEADDDGAEDVGADDDGAEDDGYLLGIVTNARDRSSALVVLDARDVAAGPVARVPLPRRVPHGFHAQWLDRDALDSHLAWSARRPAKAAPRAGGDDDPALPYFVRRAMSSCPRKRAKLAASQRARALS